MDSPENAPAISHGRRLTTYPTRGSMSFSLGSRKLRAQHEDLPASAQFPDFARARQRLGEEMERKGQTSTRLVREKVLKYIRVLCSSTQK